MANKRGNASGVHNPDDDLSLGFQRSAEHLTGRDRKEIVQRYAAYSERTVQPRLMDEKTYLIIEVCLRKIRESDQDTAQYLEEAGAVSPEGLAKEFLREAGRGNLETVQSVLASGFPINFQDPRTRRTALHSAAAHGASKIARYLSGQPNCNHLLRDMRGRLASELAFCDGRDEELADELLTKEREQAEQQGVELTIRPPS